MALTDNPYLQLYVKDWMTSNKMRMCSPAAHGVLINVLCVLHRENQYGSILLKQKFKQSDNRCLNFANQLARILPFDVSEIDAGLSELIEERVLLFDGDRLYSEKLETIAAISEKRSKAGSKGGKQTSKKFAKAKVIANTGIDNETATDIGNSIKVRAEKFSNEIMEFDKYSDEMKKEFVDYWTEPNRSKTKMKFEQQATWDTSRRLSRWSKNNFSSKPGKEQPDLTNPDNY